MPVDWLVVWAPELVDCAGVEYWYLWTHTHKKKITQFFNISKQWLLCSSVRSMNNIHEINVQFRRSYELIFSLCYLPELLNRAGQNLVMNLIFSTLVHCSTHGTRSSHKIFKQQSLPFPTVRQPTSTLAYPPFRETNTHTHIHTHKAISKYLRIQICECKFYGTNMYNIVNFTLY
jgi:hypothetical protein